MVEYSSRSLDAVFGAVADGTRRAILRALERGPATVTAIARPFPVSLNAVSKHLMVIERAGLIRREIMGREHRLRLEPKPLLAARAWLDHYRSSWESRLDALEQHVITRRAAKAGAAAQSQSGATHADTGRQQTNDSPRDRRAARGGVRRVARSRKHPPLDVPRR